MKKTVSILLVIAMCALFVPETPLGTADAAITSSAGIASSSAIRPCRRGTFRVRKNTKKGTRILNAALAAGVGAAVGGGLGGGRGALLGAGTGSGGYLIYRYVKDRRGRCVPRYVRG